MPRNPFRNRPALADELRALAAAPEAELPALLARLLVPRLRRRAGLSAVLAALAAPGASNGREGRLADLVLRMAEQVGLNRRPARTWTEAQRRRVFDPDWLVRPAAGDPALAEAATALWREAAEGLRAAGHDPAGLALESLGYGDEARRRRPAG